MKKKDIKDTKKTKEIKFETKQLKNTSVDHNNSAVVTFIIALIVIAVLVGGLYYVNAKFVTKDKYQGDDTTTTTTKEPSYDDTIILADDALKQKEKEYMVLFFDKSKDDSSYYSSLVSGYKGDSKIYSVDLSSKMNEAYYAKDGNVNEIMPENMEGFKTAKIANPTLIKVKKGKIVEMKRNKQDIYSAIAEVKFN